MANESNHDDALEPKLTDDVPTPKQPTLSKNEIRLQNLKSVFGSGAGRIAMLAAIFFVLLLGSVALRNLSSNNDPVNNKNKVEQAKAPTVEASNDPITEKEAIRQNNFENKQADKAQTKGQSFQPSFQTNITQPEQDVGAVISASQDSLFTETQLKQLNIADEPEKQQQDKQDNNKKDTSSRDSQKSNSYQMTPEEVKSLNDEYKRERSLRDSYLTSIRKQNIDDIKALIGDGQNDPLNKLDRYTTVSLNTVNLQYQTISNNAKNPLNPDSTSTTSAEAQSKKVIIKTGNVMYGSINSKMDTDKGMDVYATIHGGAWDKSVLIGKIVRTADDVNLIFTTLAPQDNRPTMKIQALALSEKDASPGMSTEVDRHTLQKWGSLFASSVLKGFATPYQNIGTTTSTGTSTTQTRPSPNTTEIVASALGEFGSNAADQIKKGFDREDTYKAPANTGFALFFLSDVTE